MARYLDPKADLTFKKVFGEHKDLMISFLNAMLPLDGNDIKSIEYLPAEIVPDNPLKKDTIVDVRCTDQNGRSFIVEMQMIWTAEFMKRVLFNSSKAYVRQLDKGGSYIDLQPVYSLNLVNDTFRDDTDECYHDYGLMDIKYKNHIIEGMHLIFIELPKFKPSSFNDKKMTALWLRFLTEINEKTEKAPDELLENPETKKALGIVEESAYTNEQMASYDRFWDSVSRERTLIDSTLKHGFEKGMAQGIVDGARQEKTRNAKTMKNLGLPVETISKVTGLSINEIDSL